jgi:hypothetical protein
MSLLSVAAGVTILGRRGQVLGAGTGTSDIWILEQFEPAVSPWTRWMHQGIVPF